MLIKALRFLLGYVGFTVGGEFPERLFNQLAVNGVSVWGMRRHKHSITAFMSARNYLKMRQYRGKSHAKVRVKSRHGLPFIVKRYRLRLGFPIGIILFFAVLFIMSGYIWNIDIAGNTNIPSSEIKSALFDLGLSEGIKKSTIDEKTLRTKLALKVDGIAWCSINIEGVRATVNISESIDTEKTDNTPCNLVAACDGIILGHEVQKGSVAVKVGQTVTAGDLLVSGVTEYKDGTSSIGASAGKVYAQTVKILECKADFKQVITKRTGAYKEKKVLTFFGLDIPLYLGSEKNEYEVEKATAVYKKNGMYLPIYLTTAKFYETKQTEFTLSKAEAEDLARKMLKKQEQQYFKDIEILSFDVSVSEGIDGVTAHAEYICRENIAKKDFLLIYEDK